MEHLPKKIHQNGISYTLVGEYYIPDLELPEESYTPSSEISAHGIKTTIRRG